MVRADAPLPARVVVRKLVLTFMGVLLFAAGLTVVFSAMRAVMDVGGYCASGGPYEIRQECPDGVWLIFVGVIASLVGTGLVAAGTFRDGPKLWTLAWPALFCALGWNFLQYGIDPPPPDDGPVWGWLVCAVTFIAMGGVPLLFVLWNAKLTLWGSSSAKPARASTTASAATPTTAATPARSTVLFGTTSVTPAAPPNAASNAASKAAPSTGSAPSAAAASATDGDDDRDLVADLERLSVLHREGQLTDDEFARAKDARLAEETR